MAKHSTEFVLRPVTAQDTAAFATFLATIGNDPHSKYFHPHPMTREAAQALCEPMSGRKDRYCIGAFDGMIVAYSMLRGWDEGYEVPSFGGCVSPMFRGLGLGRWLLVQSMHDSRAAGAKRIRLTVYKQNANAVKLYRDLGFAYSDKNDAELIGLRDLTGELPDCDASAVLQKVAARAEQLRSSWALAGN